MDERDPVGRCSRLVSELIGSVIPPGRPVALVDYPSSVNCGDHAIWLGEKALLAAHGVEVAYQCDAINYDRQRMADSLGDGVVLMHGGGNFGDLYDLYHEFRLRVMEDFPGNPVVVLPQHATFLKDGYLERTRILVGRHPNVTLIARGVATHHLFSRQFGDRARIELAPDMAFALGRMARAHQPIYDVVWLSRVDREKRHGADVEALLGLADAPTTMLNMGGFADGLALGYEIKHHPGAVAITDWNAVASGAGAEATSAELSFDDLSEVFVSRARMLLSLGRMVITDRLHGHILCLLLDVPHILLNSATGKTWDFYETWTRGSPLCHLASSPAHAWELAQAVMANPEWPTTRFAGWSQDPPSMAFDGLEVSWTLCRT